MLAHTPISIETLLLLALAALVLPMFNRQTQRRASRLRVSTTDYLFKIARITGRSEYEIFCKSAEAWPVSTGMVDRDFRQYLISQHTPHYVNDFIRRHRGQIDELELPPV
jgi:hypothetical protein